MPLSALLSGLPDDPDELLDQAVVAAPKPYKVVSFYTADNEYAQHAERLKASLERFETPFELFPVANVGPWEHICALKARFIRDQWLATDVPLVWIDADATIEAPLSLFETLDTDFAIHKWDGWQFGTGTIYFGKSEATLALINQWVLRCEADPTTWDQIHLQSAWCDINALRQLKTAWLPRSYLQIYDASEDEPAVIKHWQASRQERSNGRMTGQPQFEHTARGIANRRENRLWRTAEEAFWISEGTEHIKPEVGFAFPEGFDLTSALDKVIGSHFPVLEIGCGVGRIASLFKPEGYIGVDINPAALLQARASLPEHNFRIFDDGFAYPEASCAILYTVLLHVDDAALPRLLAEASRGRERFIISEIMDSRWRRGGNPPVFNRNPEDYILRMQELGFKLVASHKYAYERYNAEPWNVGRDSRLTFLAFEPA